MMTEMIHRTAQSDSDQDSPVIDWKNARERLSKLPRDVRWQSRHLTMQESLTPDITTNLHEEPGANDVVVETQGRHLCEAMCGVERATEATTRAVTGAVSEAVVRRFEHATERSSSQ